MSRSSCLLSLVLAALLLGACDTIPVLDRGQRSEGSTESDSRVRVIPLEDLDFESGFDPETQLQDLDTAIEDDLRTALDSQPPARQSAYLDAARKLIDARRLEDARTILDEVITTGLPAVIAGRKTLLQAEIYYLRDDLDRAARYLDRGLRAGNMDPAYIAEGLDIAGRIELRQKRPLEAARAWIRRDDYLTNSQAVASNHERIWFALGHLNELQLQVAGQAADPELTGWLDLAILFLELGADQQDLRTAVNRWSDANRAHPAADFSDRLIGPQRAAGVRQIALLLPLSSNFGGAARVVHDGFDAAHQTDSDPRRPQMVFYDVGAEPELSGNYVGVAASDGADVIVGPLGKAAVNALLESRQPEKPMVLLGSASTDPLSAVTHYQFDLAPEPEARQVAELMYASGHRRVAALHPNDEWGQRVYQAFRDRWEALGGSLAEAGAYTPGADDFTATLQNLFNLTESENRKAYLRAKSGLNLEFDPRRRRDIDALFMAARPDEARLLKPQINFFQGHDLPVYSTSHVYTGSPDAVKDTDLDGIVFPEMPWVLGNTVRLNRLRSGLAEKGFSNVSSKLFAFGYDAYQLALLVSDPGLAGRARMSGLSSELVVGADGRIHRRMEWSRFKDGVPVRIWAR